MNASWNEVKDQAITWMDEAGEMLKDSLTHSLQVKMKSNPNDLVTEMDYKIERYLTKKIKSVFPDHLVLGEEETGADINTTDGILWIIDPIDGTTNFVHQKFNFAISVAIVENGVGKVGIVYNVMHDEWYSAVQGEGAYLNKVRLPEVTPTSLTEAVIGLNGRWLAREQRLGGQSLHRMVRKSRSVRSYGSASIELAFVAAGRLDSYISFGLSPWDYAAGLVMLKEVGIVTSDFKGNPPSYLKSGAILAARPNLHEELLEYVYEHNQEEFNK